MLPFSALACAAFTTSALAFPTPAEPLFTSRMVRRQSDSGSSSSCGEYVLQEPTQLQVSSYNDTSIALNLGLATGPDSRTQLLSLKETSGGLPLFDFQTCNYQGFTQGYSRNSGGSMGAPLEYWGRVVSNVTTGGKDLQTKCLTAIPASNFTEVKVNSFQLEECDETKKFQWFRLQEGLGGALLSYFPIKNESGYVYDGQTPDYFKVNLHPEGDAVEYVQFTTETTQEFVRFEQ